MNGHTPNTVMYSCVLANGSIYTVSTGHAIHRVGDEKEIMLLNILPDQSQSWHAGNARNHEKAM